MIETLQGENLHDCYFYYIIYIMLLDIFGSSTTWDKSTAPPKFDPTELIWPPDHDSTLHVTETAALTTRPSLSSYTTSLVTKVIDILV